MLFRSQYKDGTLNISVDLKGSGTVALNLTDAQGNSVATVSYTHLMPTRMLEMADSYTYATLRNEIISNTKSFSVAFGLSFVIISFLKVA